MNNDIEKVEGINPQEILEYIEKNNIIYEEFCKRCGISTSTLNRIIHGKNFNMKSLFKIARTINIPVYMLFY